MTMYDIISLKRDGKELSPSQIKFWINGVVSGKIPDYQTSALLMAIYLNGMTAKETTVLTMEMAQSGDKADLSPLGDKTVDKHSSGGVGDKTTFIAAPIAAAAGAVVAKMSGRGLGHTGGTVDKLESIPNIKTALSTEEFLSIARSNNFVLAGQTGNFAPADKKIYALRDVTATVGSIPLIASSIMSKKIASGAKSIVLDVKVGSGAFMKSTCEAEELAKAMINIGKNCGRKVTAVLSNMDIPLGLAVGNSLELSEAAELLKNPVKCDLLEVSFTLASEMISLSLGVSVEEAKEKAKEVLTSGKAFQKLCDMVDFQGGDSEYLKNTELFKKASNSLDIRAQSNGYITNMNTEEIGICSVKLGAGRQSLDDKIDYSAGIKIYKKTGDKVNKGEVMATLYADDLSLCKSIEPDYLKAVEIGEKIQKPDTILKILR